MKKFLVCFCVICMIFSMGTVAFAFSGEIIVESESNDSISEANNVQIMSSKSYHVVGVVSKDDKEDWFKVNPIKGRTQGDGSSVLERTKNTRGRFLCVARHLTGRNTCGVFFSFLPFEEHKGNTRGRFLCVGTQGDGSFVSVYICIIFPILSFLFLGGGIRTYSKYFRLTNFWKLLYSLMFLWLYLIS